MAHLARALLVPLLAAVAPTARASGQDTRVASAPTAEQALQKEFQQTARALYEATTDEERVAVAARMAALSLRVLHQAEQHADDPQALDGLVQVVVQELWLENNTDYPGRPGASLEDRAIALLLQHHLRSPWLGEACTRVSYGFRKDCETFLRMVLARSPHPEVQGLACLRLAQFLNGRLRRLDLLSASPERTARYEGLFGKDYVGELERQDRAAAVKEIESIFTRAASEFGDTGLPYGGKVRETANSELFEIRHMAVGMVAPELQGQDQDGVPLKLSDYRGKVVLLYFWSEY